MSKGYGRKGQVLGPLEVPILEVQVPQLLHWIQAEVPLSPLYRLRRKQAVSPCPSRALVSFSPCAYDTHRPRASFTSFLGTVQTISHLHANTC